MRSRPLVLCACGILMCTAAVRAQSSSSTSPSSKSTPDVSAKKSADAESELQKALNSAGNDRAALVRNLKDYLRRFPDAPRRPAIDRALVEACQQLRDDECALDYSEQLIALQPD